VRAPGTTSAMAASTMPGWPAMARMVARAVTWVWVVWRDWREAVADEGKARPWRRHSSAIAASIASDVTAGAPVRRSHPAVKPRQGPHCVCSARHCLGRCLHLGLISGSFL